MVNEMDDLEQSTVEGSVPRGFRASHNGRQNSPSASSSSISTDTARNGSDPQSSPPGIEWSRVNPCLVIVTLLVVIVLIAAVVVSSNPFYTLIFILVAVLPAIIFLRIIKRRFHDDAVPSFFLVSQFLFAAVPLTFIVFIVETLLSLIFFFIVLSPELSALLKRQDDEPLSIEDLKALIPTWKLVTLALLSGYIVAAITEESAKWLLSRRYRRINEIPSNQQNDLRISVRGVLAIASVSALGFATFENVLYLIGWSEPSKTGGFPIGRAGLAVLRDIFAFPLHIGTTFVIALVEARRFVLSDTLSVWSAFATAIFFHGTFDASALVIAALVLKGVLPEWCEAIAVAIQAVLVILLVVLCRSRFQALIERERALAVDDSFSFSVV